MISVLLPIIRAKKAMYESKLGEGQSFLVSGSFFFPSPPSHSLGKEIENLKYRVGN